MNASLLPKCMSLFAGALCIAIALPVMAASAPRPASSDSPITLVRAVSIAEATIKGQVMEVDRDRRKDGRLIYEIDVVQGQTLRELEIDAYSGAVLKNRREHLEGWFWRVNGNALSTLKEAQPLSVTLRTLEADTGGEVIDVDFDTESGQSRYEVELSTRTGVAGIYLDPRSGKRLAFVVDD